MGKLEDGADYREILRREEITVPSTDDDDDDSVDDDDGDSDDVTDSSESNEGEEDIEAGIPVQASTTGGVDPQSREGHGSHGRSQAVSHGQSSQSPPTGVTEGSRKESRDESRANPEVKKTKLPDA